MSPKPVTPAVVPVDQLQFRHAEAAEGPVASRRCAVCKSPVYGTYYHAAGKDVCPNCTGRLQSLQVAPGASTLATAALYGGGAAIAGCALYAFIAVALNLELALVAILIGFMVGKGVRYGSKGLGGRPQQILAVLLTYFSITISYVVVAVYLFMERGKVVGHIDWGNFAVRLLGLAAIAPFMGLERNFASGALSLVIIFFGLRRAWAMTGRPEIPIFGPYEPSDPS